MDESDVERNYFGVWSKDEFIDSLVFSLFAAIVTAVITMLYRYVSKWLELKKWGY